MASYTLRYLTAVCLVVVASAQGPAHPPLVNFPGPQRQLEDRVDQLETKVSVMEQRESAMSQAFTREMTTLAKDSGAIKTTVTRLVEDGVQMMGRVRILQDVGQDVVDLRKHVSEIQNEANNKVSQVQTQVNQVSGKLDQLASASQYITVGLSTQMKQNKDLLQSIQAAMAGLKAKLTAAEQKVASLERTGGSKDSGVETLRGKIQALNETLSAYKREQQDKIAGIEGEIDALRNK